jgi:glycosyltransferase involved in cell wall biosynthesis
MPAPTKLLVVIPAFNEALRIRGVVTAVRGQVAADVLVVDDGSRDATAAEARAAGAMVATHPVNLGYGSALQTGYRYALRHAYEAVLQLDADGQHDPASIPPLLAALASHDVVVGSRFLHPGSYRPPPLRRLGMSLFGAIASRLSGQRLGEVPVRMLGSPAGKGMHGGVLKPLYYVFRMTLALALVPLRNERP